jgi:predicted O-linked N-acetylglucosamine transferase (SPINDLY family)
VQISYVNHHATTAVPNIDYVLGDAMVAEGPDRDFFTEQIYSLPGCFFCFDLRGTEFPFRAEPPCATNSFVTFGCFGTGAKLNLRLIELWAAILDRVPGSRLFLRNRDLSPADNRRFIAGRFARFGIDPARLLLMGGTDHGTIMRNYAEIDISLDTWPYCGGNTIAESFWQGVPVVTLMGDRFSARYGASLVRAHGCPDLVAASMDEYVEIAAALAEDRPRLAAYRRDLRDMTAQHGFNDSEAFARKLEAAFQEMLNRLA